MEEKKPTGIPLVMANEAGIAQAESDKLLDVRIVAQAYCSSMDQNSIEVHWNVPPWRVTAPYVLV